MFRHGSLAAEADPAAIVNVDDFDRNLVAQGANILDFVDPVVGHLGDMHQAFLARHEFDESAKVLDRFDNAAVDLADFDFAGAGFNQALGIFHARAVACENFDRAVILNVNLGASGVDDAADVLTSRADEAPIFSGLIFMTNIWGA